MRFWIFVLLSLAFLTHAADLTTKSGKTYSEVYIDGPRTKGLAISHIGGAAIIPYWDLPDDLRARYKAEEEKAAAAQKQRKLELVEQRQQHLEQKKLYEKRKQEAEERKKKEQERRAAEEAERRAGLLPIKGMYGYQLGDELTPNDVLGGRYSWQPTVKPRKGTLPEGVELSVWTTREKKFISRLSLHGATYNGLSVAELYSFVSAFKDRYPDAVGADEKTLPGEEKVLIAGRYRHEYEGRIAKMEFEVSNLTVSGDQLKGTGVVRIILEDNLLTELDSVYGACQVNKLEEAKRSLEKIFHLYPFKKKDPQYTRLAFALEEELKSRSEAHKAAEEERFRAQKVEEARIEANPISEKYDKMEKFTWYETARDSEKASCQGYRIEPYFGKHDNGRVILRMRTSYRGSNWVFYERVKLLGDNGVELTFTTEPPQKKSDIFDGGSIEEWSDDNLTSSSERLIALAQAGSIFVKFYGRYNGEFEMTPLQLKIFKEVIARYQELRRN